MNIIFLVLFFIVGVINFLPVIGIISASKLSQAYSIELASNDLIILMRHRALLFGIVGGFIFYSIFKVAVVDMVGIVSLAFAAVLKYAFVSS
jgi:hypothetical protein